MKVSDEMKKTIGRAIGRVPSGVFVLTTRHAGHTTAMLASWVQQAAFEPPAVSVAIAKQRPIAELIRRSGRFALSVLGEDDSHFMRKYARGVEPGADPFDEVSVVDTPAGVPVLAGALAWLDCRLLQAFDFGGDHELFVGEVTEGRMLKEGHAFSHQRGNGFHY